MFKYVLTVLTMFFAASGAYAQEGRRAGKKPLPRIVVAGFANKTGSDEFDWVGYGLNASLTRRLLRVKGLVTTDVAAYNRARNELGLQRKDLSDSKEALKVGKALGVDKVLVGEYGRAPTGVKVVARFVDTATGKVVGREISRTGPALSVTAELALDVAKQLGTQLGEKAAVTRNLTDSHRAYENHCKGLQYKESKETCVKAIEHFYEAAKADKKFAPPHLELACLFVIKGTEVAGERRLRYYQIALKRYRSAVKLYPEYAEAYNNMGVLYAYLNENQNALRALRKAVRIIPNYASAHSSLARLYDMMGKYDRAIAGYRKAIELNPNDAVIHNNLGAALFNRGEFDDALKAYSEALKIKPELKDAHLGLGMIYDHKDKKSLAVLHYQKFLDLGGQNDDVMKRLEQLKEKSE